MHVGHIHLLQGAVCCQDFIGVILIGKQYHQTLRQPAIEVKRQAPNFGLLSGLGFDAVNGTRLKGG
jgi:hypothetical protein